MLAIAAAAAILPGCTANEDPTLEISVTEMTLTQEALDNIANTTVSNMRKFASGEPSPETEVCYHCSRKDDCRKERHQKCF